MNVFERALTPETYTNALANPGNAIKNVVSDPGFGLVAGAMLGMPTFGGFAPWQAALMTGGISTLATGSLQKGLMTGLSAYGGAGLGASLSEAGAAEIAAKNAANLEGSGATILPGAMTGGAGEASALDALSAGAKSVTSSPEAALDFAKNNYGKALMAAGPILADKMVQTKTPLPSAGSLAGPSYIRPYVMRRTVRQPQAGIGSREQQWFDTSWEAGNPYKAANGGIVALAGGGMTSQDAYDFLMGKSSAPAVETATKAPTFEGRYEFDTSTGTTRWVPARVDMTPKTATATTKTPTTTTSGITTLIKGAGDVTGVNQAKTNAFFNNMTPQQKADHEAQMTNLSKLMTPVIVQMAQEAFPALAPKDPNTPPAPVVDMSTQNDAVTSEGDMGPATPVAITSSVSPVSTISPTSIGAVGEGDGGDGGPGIGGPGIGGGGGGIGMGGTASGVGTGIGGLGGMGGGLAGGGITDAYNLGSYSDGGRLLRGPGDGVSDSIPATIGNKQPARLADGEFVIPARIVSEIGNGSTEAGARKLYKMMDRIQAARGKTVGKGKVAANTRADKYLPA